MERTSFDTTPCSIARSLDVLGDWWTPLIIRECLYGVHRFDEMQRWLGIGRNILSRRLTQLVRQGVIEKRPCDARAARFEYHLTEKGYDAAKVLLAIMTFGEKWYFERGRAPIRLFHRTSREPVRAEIVDAATGAPLDVRELYAGPGPGFPRESGVRHARFAEYYEREAKTRSR